MTLTTEEVLEKSKKLCDTLTSGDVLASPYKRGPVNNEMFIVNIGGNTIRLWAGIADIKTHISKQHRQAVLNIIEEPRKVTRRVGLDEFYKRDSRDFLNPSDQQIDRWRRGAIERFPIFIPNAKFSSPAEVEFDEMKTSINEKNQFGQKYRVVVSVTASAPKTELSLLMGWDETRQFISALPKMTDSVEEAHKMLLGVVPPGTLRQGEWFFIPVTENEQKLINNHLATKKTDKIPSRYNNTKSPFSTLPLEKDSSHWASCLITVGSAKYVVGLVYDTRGTRHAPLMIPTWHKVVRNKEIMLPQEPVLTDIRTGKVTRGVRHRGWD